MHPCVFAILIGHKWHIGPIEKRKEALKWFFIEWKFLEDVYSMNARNFLLSAAVKQKKLKILQKYEMS